MKNVYGNRVLITGASSGIGEACARMFAENGCSVTGVSRHCKEETRKLPGGGSLAAKRLDVTDEEAVRAFVSSEEPFDIAALCAGLEAEPACIHRLSFEGTVGNPVLFPRSTFEELCNLPEGKGGGAVVKAHPDLVRTVEASDERELIDVDTPEILQSLL